MLFWMKIGVWRLERYQLNSEQPQDWGCGEWLCVPSWAPRVRELCFSLLFCKGQEFTARLPEGAGKAAAFEWPGWVLGSRSFSEITSVMWTIKHTGWILSDISYRLFLFSCLMIFLNQLEQRNNMMQTESREDKLNFNDTTLSTINISLTKTTNPFGH